MTLDEWAASSGAASAASADPEVTMYHTVSQSGLTALTSAVATHGPPYQKRQPSAPTSLRMMGTHDASKP